MEVKIDGIAAGEPQAIRSIVEDSSAARPQFAPHWLSFFMCFSILFVFVLTGLGVVFFMVVIMIMIMIMIMMVMSVMMTTFMYSRFLVCFFRSNARAQKPAMISRMNGL